MVYLIDVFCVLCLMYFDDVKVVILGQDLYYGDDCGMLQVYGFVFLVLLVVCMLLLLCNIFKEIVVNFGYDMLCYGCFDMWVWQGVLLFNIVLMVECGVVVSYVKCGWE